MTLEGNLGWQRHGFGNRFRLDHRLPMEMDRCCVFRLRGLWQWGRRLHLVPGVLLRPVATWRHWNLPVTTDLSETNVGDAEFLPKCVDRRFPDALVELFASKGYRHSKERNLLKVLSSICRWEIDFGQEIGRCGQLA